MLTTILLTLGIGYIVIVLFMYFFQSKMIYYPYLAIVRTPADVFLKFEDVRVEIANLKVHGWWIPAEQPRGTILFCHGNAGNISHRIDSILIFHKLDYNVMIFDYRGYGLSEGSPSEQGTYEDGEAFWNFLVTEKQQTPEDIVLFGRSLGGGVASWLAVKQPCRGIILESTFTSVPDLAAQIYPFLPVKPLAKIRYPSLERLPQIHCPVLIIHSPDDELIPYSHGQKLFEAANEPKSFLELQGSHNEGYMLSAVEYVKGLKAYFQKLDNKPYDNE